MEGLVRIFSFVALTVIFCVGCERTADPVRVQFGVATLQRKADFIKAIENALKGFDELNDPTVSIALFDDGGRQTVSVKSDGSNPRAMERAVAVVVTNIALKYSGVGFMRMSEGAWKILIPDETLIPVEGEFGLNIQ